MPDARTMAVLRLAQPRLARFAPGALLGLLSAANSVALLATSAWLITRAAEHPPILFLSAAIVGVRAFALGRAGFRYADRLASHDAAFRQLAAVRVGIYSRLDASRRTAWARPRGATSSLVSSTTSTSCRTCRSGSCSPS